MSDSRILSHSPEAVYSARRPNDSAPYYTSIAELKRVYERCRASPDRTQIYQYLTGVMELVVWWKSRWNEKKLARRILRARNGEYFVEHDLYLAVIYCSSDPSHVSKQVRSRWAIVMKRAERHKRNDECLREYVARCGGMNAVARRQAIRNRA